MGNIKDGHKYLWGSVVEIGEIDKNIFYYKMINFLLRELKFLGNMYFSFIERIALAKTESPFITEK